MQNAPELLFILAIVALTAGELIAYFDAAPGNTLSERVRLWASGSAWRKLALIVGLFFLYMHLAYGWPW